MVYTRPTLTAGSRILDTRTDAFLDQIDSLTSPAETSYTPAWTSSGTAPAVGNATRVGKYWRAESGLWVDVFVKFTFGTTSTYGTGVYFFSLPVNAAADQVASAIGTAYYLDSGTAEGGGIVKCESASTIRIVPAEDTNSNNWGQTAPITWTTNDVLQFTCRYRAA